MAYQQSIQDELSRGLEAVGCEPTLCVDCVCSLHFVPVEHRFDHTLLCGDPIACHLDPVC